MKTYTRSSTLPALIAFPAAKSKQTRPIQSQIILFEFTLHKNAHKVRRDLIRFLKEDEGYEEIDTKTYQLSTTACDKSEKKLRKKLQNYFSIRSAKNTDPGSIEFSIRVDNQLLYNENWPLR